MKQPAMSNYNPCVNACIPSEDPAIICGRPALRPKPGHNLFHGWLCLMHYLQQAKILQQTRQFVKVPKAYVATPTDHAIIADILTTEREKISAGSVTTIRFGSLNPEYVRYWSS